MNLVALPPWLPWWAPIAVLIPLLLYALVFLLMPFSVFGVKSRLDAIEARLDEIQGEIRSLVLRLPPAGRIDHGTWPTRGIDDDTPPIPPARDRARADTDDLEADDLPPPRVVRTPTRPPIPDDPRRRGPVARAEPRLDWRS